MFVSPFKTKLLFQLCEEEGLADAHFLISILGLANTIPRWERGTKEKLIKTKTKTTTMTK